MRVLNTLTLRILIGCFLLITPSVNTNATPRTDIPGIIDRNKQETVVYITKTGKKYHRESCRYLSQSKIKTTLKKAVAAGNGACKICKP